MRILLLALFSVLLLSGCGQDSKPPQPSPTPQAWDLKWQEGRAQKELKNYEDAAVLLRESLDLMEQAQAPKEKVTIAQQDCIVALSKAGGFLDSQTLWKDMLEKNPDSKAEAERMLKRAEKYMRLQGDELAVQAQADRAEGHLSKAEATIRAAIFLYQKAGESDNQVKAASKILDEITNPESPSASPSPE